MILQWSLLIILLGMLGFIIIAPFNPPVFFSMGALAVAIGIWAIITLLQLKRENLAVK